MTSNRFALRNLPSRGMQILKLENFVITCYLLV